MSVTHEYRCLSCLDDAVTRDYNVSHLSRTCDACGEFGRFVNGAVLDQFDAFEDTPPAEFDWERLDRMEKLLVAERLVRTTYTLDDIDIETDDDEA